MANRTVKDSHTVKGTNPQYLVEKIIRSRIYDSKYWKEECFALSAELLVDKAMELKFVGGVYGGNVKPTPFLCLVLKMLQIQPEKDIVVEFIKNEDYKYVRALGATYMRLVGDSLDCYKYIEPLYNDYRKLKRQNRDGSFCIVHMDEYIDELLREDHACGIVLPRLQKRHILEQTNALELRISALDEDREEELEEELDDELVEEDRRYEKPHDTDQSSRKYRHSPERLHDRYHDRSLHRRRELEPDRRERDRHFRDRRRERSRSREHERSDRYKRERYERDRHREKDKLKEDRLKDKSRLRDRDRDREKKDLRDKKKRKKHKESRRDGDSSRDIYEANALRERLGLKPLR